ncbi:MAG: hypothetical protein ACLRWP_16605 [Bilophila wadsworthia]
MAVVGALTSIACFLMLAVPGSPAAIGVESWIMLLAWVAIGACFYFSRASILRSIPKRVCSICSSERLTVRCFLPRRPLKKRSSKRTTPSLLLNWVRHSLP